MLGGRVVITKGPGDCSTWGRKGMGERGGKEKVV